MTKINKQYDKSKGDIVEWKNQLINRYKARTFISNLGKKLITNGQLSDRNRIACHETGSRTAVDISNREYRAIFHKRFRLRAIILRTVFYWGHNLKRKIEEMEIGIENKI